MTNQCPQCGATLPAGALQGLCPACLLREGAAEETATQGGAPFDPPGVEEVARLFPQLEILAFIGKGGMGAVYKARQPALDRLVALKILPSQTAGDPGFAGRFNREARALAKLSHPNIVALHEFGQVNGLPFFIMEFVDGLNLRQLERAGKLSPREALQIVPQICEALQFAHDEGIVHRDIKPENILLDKKGRVKIADFGIAKIMGAGGNPLTRPSDTLPPTGGEGRGEGGTPALTEAGKTIGTPNYMAPEQIETPQAVDHRADIYSLGVVFYEMLTGELPLGKFAPPSSRIRGVHVDVRLDEVVLRALEKEPEHRYQHASQVRTAVETIAGAPPSGGGEPVNPPSSKSEIEPRFSRLAIVGACWSVFGVLAALFSISVASERGPGWTLNHLGYFLAVTLVPLGITALFGTTMLGWIAVSQIRRSEGRLYGLGLAVFDGLLFPLLALDGLLVGGFWFLALGLLARVIGEARDPRGLDHLFIGIWIFASVFSSVLLDWLIVRRVWRAVGETGDSKTTPAAISGGGSLNPPLAWVALFFAGLAGVLGFIDFCLFPNPPVLLDWSILASALTGIGLAIPARHCRIGRQAILVGYVNSAIWLVLTGVVLFQNFPRQQPKAAGTLAERQRLANNPGDLPSVPILELIQVGLTSPQVPWAWQELKKRAEAGQFGGAEADELLDNLAGWFRRDYPGGYDQPLFAIGELLDELNRRQLLGETNVMAFLEAYCGSPSLGPLPRVRETDRGMFVSCKLRSPWWNNGLLGVQMLNVVRSISIDGESVAPHNLARQSWNQVQYDAQLGLLNLPPGRHILRYEVESALVPVADMAGLAVNAPPADWPPARRRWTRVCQSGFTVYAKDTEIVSLSEDPALDPVANGALSVKQVIIRPKGGHLTAIVSFGLDPKPGVPISADVTLRLAGQATKCGSVWAEKIPNGISSSGSELTADIGMLDGQIQEAEVVLTPNPSASESHPGIDRIWGKEIVFRHVQLMRQDLTGVGRPETAEATFGPVIERVMNFDRTGANSANGLDSDRIELPFAPGLATNLDPVAIKQNKISWNSSGADALFMLEVPFLNKNAASNTPARIAQLIGLTCFHDTLVKLIQPSDWDTATAGWVAENAGAIHPPGKSELGELPKVYLFKTGTGSMGILQITGSTNGPPGVKIRYKLVRNGASDHNPAPVDAAAALAALREFGDDLLAAATAVDNKDAAAADKLRQALQAILSYNEKAADPDLAFPSPLSQALNAALSHAGTDWDQAQNDIIQVVTNREVGSAILGKRVRLLTMMGNNPAVLRELLEARIQQALESSNPVRFGKYLVHFVQLSDDSQKALVRFLSSPSTYWDATLTRDEFGRWTGSVPAVNSAGMYPIEILVPDMLPVPARPPIGTNELASTAENPEVLRLKLQAAEQMLQEVQKRVDTGTAAPFDAAKARFERDTLAAELKGDSMEAARLKLQFADLELSDAAKRKAVGLIPPGEYDKLKLTRDIAAAELKQLQQTTGK